MQLTPINNLLITLGDLISLPIHERTALRRDAVLSAAAVCPHAAAWAGGRSQSSRCQRRARAGESARQGLRLGGARWAMSGYSSNLLRQPVNRFQKELTGCKKRINSNNLLRFLQLTPVRDMYLLMAVTSLAPSNLGPAPTGRSQGATEVVQVGCARARRLG